MSGNAILGLNSTSTPLASSGTWTGEWTDVAQWDAVVLAVRTDAGGTMYADFSPDGTNADSTLTFEVAANINEVHRITITRRWFRVRYVNDDTAQTFMRLQCIAGGFQTLSAALNSTISLDADAIVTRSLPSILELGRGRFIGITKNNKSGRNGDIDTATVPEWIWENGGVYTGFPLGDPETLRVVSTDANDTAAGTGARSVRVTGLDENWLIQTETIPLNGTTPSTGSLLFRRVHTAFVSSTGNSNQAFNAGIITVSHSITTANVFLTIQPGRNQSNAAVYTVPDGKIGIKLGLKIEVDRANASSVAGFVWVREPGAPARYRRPFTASNTSRFEEEPYGGLTYPAKTDIGVVVTSCTANNTAVQASFDIILVDDD